MHPIYKDKLPPLESHPVLPELVDPMQLARNFQPLQWLLTLTPLRSSAIEYLQFRTGYRHLSPISFQSLQFPLAGGPTLTHGTARQG
jgi:hypothetical protein